MHLGRIKIHQDLSETTGNIRSYSQIFEIISKIWKKNKNSLNKFQEQKFSNKAVYIAETSVFYLSTVSKH